MSEYFVYILYSATTDKLHIGQTNSLKERLRSHNNGYNKSTKHGIPWILYSYIKLDSRVAALKHERKIKNLKSRKKIIHFIEISEEWVRMPSR